MTPFNTHTGVQVSFNPHTHAGCDCKTPFLKLVDNGFNPHTHAGCDSGDSECICQPHGFNPHTHAGCDGHRSKGRTNIRVSIHTPTQGVTVSIAKFNHISSFNPHTHAGCDVAYPTGQMQVGGFNPHTHAGCDAVNSFFELKSKVSIHTPTQGVTLYLITYYKSANLIHCYANHHYYSTS